MNQGNNWRLFDAADAPGGEGRYAPPILFASEDTPSGADAPSFWDQFIFALGVVPEWPCLSIWNEPQRESSTPITPFPFAVHSAANAQAAV